VANGVTRPVCLIAPPENSLPPEEVVAELRKHTFGIIGTVSRDGRPHATGVAYVTSPLGKPLALYVVTDTSTKKVRNILNNPNVSFVVPIPRRLITVAPMSCIQFQGRARLLGTDDVGALETMKSTRMGRMMLGMAKRMINELTGKLCFIMITPDPVIHTYGVGLSLFQMRNSFGRARGKIELPAELGASDEDAVS
jgi:uncharacterized protein YhbP (UPF0306 family)